MPDRIKFQRKRLRRAAAGSLNHALTWSSFIGYAAVWALTAFLGYRMTEWVDPGEVLLLAALSLGAAWLIIVLWRFIFTVPYEDSLTGGTQQGQSPRDELVKWAKNLDPLELGHVKFLWCDKLPTTKPPGDVVRTLEELRRAIKGGKLRPALTGIDAQIFEMSLRLAEDRKRPAVHEGIPVSAAELRRYAKSIRHYPIFLFPDGPPTVATPGPQSPPSIGQGIRP